MSAALGPSTLQGVIERLRRGSPLAEDQIAELERLFDVLRSEGWSGFIPADEAAWVLAAGSRRKRRR